MAIREADIIIDNCMILPMNNTDIIKDGKIAVRDGKIAYIGKAGDIQPFKADKVLEGHKKLVMPGLINCHTHAAMTLFRGLVEDIPLDKWLKEKIWPLEAKLQPEDVYIGSLLGCLEMIKNGVTCFADMYFFETQVAHAVEEVGMRAALASGIIDTVDWQTNNSLRDSIHFAQEYQGWAGGRITTRLAPHTAYTCTRETLMQIREEATRKNIGIHLHLSENLPTKTMIEPNLTEVEYLESLNFLSNDVLAAHCIHLTAEDIKTLSKRRVKVAYNPVSNMKMGQGAPRIKELLDSNITVGLGTDGAASNNSLDMFETVKTASLLQKHHYEDPKAFRAKEALELATIKGAEALGLRKDTGSLEVGKKADIILVNIDTPNMIPLHNIYSNLVYSAKGCNVDSVIIDGKIVMENRKVKTINEDEVLRRAQEQAINLIQNQSR
jgi:5-methylthioadenosine/S-adenosylhomocysteine deaminase